MPSFVIIIIFSLIVIVLPLVLYHGHYIAGIELWRAHNTQQSAPEFRWWCTSHHRTLVAVSINDELVDMVISVELGHPVSISL